MFWSRMRAHEEEGERSMTIKGKAYIAGIYEHPTRKADTQSLAQLHAESGLGALADAVKSECAMRDLLRRPATEVRDSVTDSDSFVF